MALENNFYDEIQNKEEVWMQQIQNNLLNIYYVKIELKKFYNEKLEKLRYEYNQTGNKLIEQIMTEIGVIVNKISELELEYNNGNQIDLKTLIPLFLLNKLNNTSKQERINDFNISRPEIRKQVLFALRDYHNQKNENDIQDEDICDEFDEEVIPLKK